MGTREVGVVEQVKDMDYETVPGASGDGSGVVSGVLDNMVWVWDLQGVARQERKGKKGMGMACVGCTVL